MSITKIATSKFLLIKQCYSVIIAEISNKINPIRAMKFILSILKNGLQKLTSIKEIASDKYDEEIKRLESDRFSTEDDINYSLE